MSQMLSVPLNRIRSPKLKRQTPVEDEIDGQQNQPSRSIVSDFESNSSRSLSPYWRIVADPESSSSYLDVPETTNNSRRSSNNSAVRFTPHDSSDLCSILDMSYESENLEKAIISNDKYTVRRIIDIHQNKFNLLKDHLSIAQTQSGFPIHPLPQTQSLIHPNASFGSPSITSNTDLLEAVSKQALISNDTDDPQSFSSPEHTNSMFDAASSVLTYTTGPLAAALINYHHQTYPSNYLTSNPSSLNVGSSTNERVEMEHESMFTAPTSFNKEGGYPTSDSPNDAPPIFRNVLHVAIIYDARDVMRICLKYGLDPNASGTHPNINNIPLNSQISPSNTYNQINTRLSPDLPRASPCRDGTLDYTGYYTTERLFTLPPLFLAAQRNNHYACTLLLKYGANINVRDDLYCSPLHLAARLQHNVCDILVSHHASITIPNKYDDTPLSLWPMVKHLQTSFVEREFRKLCRKYSSNSKRYKFLSRDNEQYQTTASLINFNNNSSINNNFVPGNGLKNLKRVFRYSGSDSYDSKSFKKSFSSQSSMGKSKRIVSTNAQNSLQGTSVVRSESRQLSEERDDVDISHTGRASNMKRKTGTSSLAANILHAHKSSRQQQHSATTAAHATAETNVLNDRLYKRFSELSRLATNIECIDQLMDLMRMQNSMDEILTLVSQATSPQVHARIGELLHTLLNTSYQEFLRNHDKRDNIENFQIHTKKLLDISLELLSSDMANMQYVALITINRLYDVYVYHNLINPGRYNACYIPPSRRQFNSKTNLNFNTYEDSIIKNRNDRSTKPSTLSNFLRRISRESEEKRSPTSPTESTNLKSSLNPIQQIPGSGSTSGSGGITTDCPRQMSKRWIPLNSNDNLAPSSSTSTLIPSVKDSSSDITNNHLSKSNLLNSDNFLIISNENSNTIYTYEPFSLLYQIEPIHLLRLMRTRLDTHRKEFNNRPKCVPSTRSPLCTHHCVVILAARLLTILCQDHTFQLRFIGTKENLAIIVDMLNINNDPHLICLILQTLGVVALNPDSHEILTQADIPDSVLHLILPADEMFYTNQTTKFARYVKHLGARILVYMGLLTKVSNKVNLFDILDVEPELLDCEKPQSFENNFVHHMAVGETIVGTLWASFAGICIEKLLDELLKNGINQKKSSSKESQDALQLPTSPTSSSSMINPSDNLLYNLSYLSSVIHPVIILRLLEHRIFTPLFKKKSIPTNPLILSNNNNIILTPNIGTSILTSIPTLPRPDRLVQQRNSLTQTNRKISRGTPSTSISGVTTTSSQLATNNDLSSNMINSTDLSLFLNPISTNNSNQTTTRKWFWRNSDKTIQSNIPNDRNPLLQAVIENDPLLPSGSVPTITTNAAGVGEIKLFEKELLNLPSFQLSDSQNPLLPSPTCFNYDFPTQFDSTSPTVNVIINRQYSASNINENTLTNGLQKSKLNDDDFTSSMTENVNNGGHLTALPIPFVAVRTPSDESNHSSSFNDSVSKHVSSSNPRTFVRKTVKNFFRSSKTIDNMSNILMNGNNILTNISKYNRNFLKLKSSSHLSYSQPIVNEDFPCDSSFNYHSEKTPLIERRIESKHLKISLDNTKQTHFNRQELNLPPNDINFLPRSRSCTDGIITSSNNQENDSTNPVVLSLQPNNSEAGSLRSSDSTVSSLSAYASAQQQLSIQQTNENNKNELNKSQESIFSFSSPLPKERSIKSLIMAAATNDKATKQDNDVLALIASWVLRSPEDFQDYLVQKELKSFFALLESLRSSFRIWTSQIKEILALQDIEAPLGQEMDDVITDDIYREYVKMQKGIVSGRLICSKEEAATLAAVQLRLEAWPEENLDLAEEDELHTLSLTLNDHTSQTSTMISTPWRDRHRHDIVKFHLANISCCKRVDSNTHKSKKPFLPPNFRYSNEIFKLIKDKQRKLFHINDYDNPTRLKECYVRLCRNLPGYSAEIYVVKEIHGKRSKGKGNRLLCIRSDKICLLDMKTLIISKEQRIADLEHWITSGHHLSAGINELILEFRNKTKWRLQLNTTADLRAITVYLWKIVNVEGFALLDKHIPLSSSMRRYSQTGPRMTILQTSTRNLNKNPYQTINDMYKNSPNNQHTTTDRIQNLTRTTGLMMNPLHRPSSDNTQPFCFSSDLEELKYLFDFPEEVAIRLTEIEHEIFLSVPPLQYLRHLTLDMSLLPTNDTSIQGKSIRILVQRFQAVGSFIQQLIISQTSFQERKAIVASILRCAITCWYMGNFNSAMQILAGLKIEAFRPLWLTITDEIPGFKFLTDAFNSNEKTPQYCDAVSRALDIPSCKVVPFFGTFLKDLRTILSTVPSIVVLCNRNTQKPIETVADFQNQEHFLTRIGVGGLINTRKIELVHMVLKDIAMFHNRHRRQPLLKCCNDLNRIKLPIQTLIPEMKEKHSATVCDPIIENSTDKIPKTRYNRHQSFPCTSITTDEFDQRRMTNIAIQVIGDNEILNTNNNNNNNEETTANSLLPYRSMFDIDEPETYYCLNVSFYQPISHPKHNHHVSLLSMHHIIDFNNLQMLRNGTTLILYDEDTMHTCLVTVRLELDNCTLTWTKPSWDTHRSVENVNTNNQVLSEAAHYSILMKRYVLRDVAFVDMDEGFLQLKYVKHIRSGILHCDLLPIIKRYKLNDITNPENCFTIVYGSSISENKSLCFISPKYCSQIWYLSIDKLITQYRKHRLCSDRRIVWLKNQYLSLYHENERFQGPTPMTAILIFGGRQWSSNSLFSYERDHLSSKKSNSVKKTWSNLGLKRRNKFEQDRKTSFSTESEPMIGSKWQQHHSTLALRNKSKTLECKGISSLVSSAGKSSRPLIQHQTNVKQRSGLTTNRQGNTLNNSMNNKRSGNRSLSTNTNTQIQESSSPWNIDENHMDFPEFVELFKSFYFHCRRDLKDLFDKFASEINIEQDYTIKEQYKNDLFDISRHLTGLITRNILDDTTDINIRRIYDMIAISSIPCYAISTHTRGNYLITKEQFRDFLIEHQKEEKSSYEIEQIIYRHEPNRQNRFNKVLSFEGFSRYLLDKENYAFINEYTKTIEQEMDYPLSYYFVASSHNTYLTGHQLRGESSVEMYREVLLSGCRCVELDCWDGDDGYPVIYHGRTFVSKISFKLVVEVINESAFLTSPYPVILSIENRCSLIQQARMAQTFVKVFGEKLITKYMFDTDFNEDSLLPSPNQLKYKILIKNKKISKMHSTTQLSKQKVQLSVNYRNSVYSSPDDNEEDDDSDDDELLEEYSYDQYARRESQRSNSMTDSPLYQLKKNNTSEGVEQDGDDDLSYRQRRYSIMNNEPRQRLKSSSSIDANHINKINKPVNVIVKIPTILVAKELSDIVIYTQAIKFRGLTCPSIFVGGKAIRKPPKRNIQQLVAQPSTTSTESSRSIDQVAPCHQIVSLIENKAKKLCKNQGADMVMHTETQLVRCYPSGFRVDSSNFNPLHLWIYGIQLAATNYQTLDVGQILNLSMFEQNNNCGYVLKPSIFWDKDHPQYGRFNPSVIEREGSCFELTITVISGQYLTQNISSTTSVYIEVELLGIPIDCISRKTKPSVKNSLNPIWQETFVFQLFFMELAFVRFHVYDAGSNHLMSQRILPLTCLRPGYRHVRLRDITNVPLELATLFIYSKITETILIRSPEQDLLTTNTPHLFRNRILRRTADPPEVAGASRDSIRPKHKTFEVKVYGKEGRDEEFRPFAVTQYTTVEELIEMIAKSNDFLQVGETINDIILTESSKTWKKKASSSKISDNPARILEKYERILEVIDRVGRETVILCKKKSQTSQHLSLSTLIDKTSPNSDRTFLVTIYNISSIQKHTTFRTPINSTTIHVITQLMRKIRMSGIPSDYGLVEETDLNGRNRRIPIKRRFLADDEKIYGIQRLWTSTNSKFVLVKKSEYSETNNNNSFTDKFLFRSLTRQKSIDRDSHDDLQLKSRINTNLNGNFINNRTTVAPTLPISKTNQTKRSIKTLFLTSRS